MYYISYTPKSINDECFRKVSYGKDNKVFEKEVIMKILDNEELIEMKNIHHNQNKNFNQTFSSKQTFGNDYNPIMEIINRILVVQINVVMLDTTWRHVDYRSYRTDISTRFSTKSTR